MTRLIRNNCVRNKKFRKFKGPWFRVYTADVDSYHLQRLPAAVKWTWIELCALAAESNGLLPDHEQIAYRLREAEHNIVAAIDVLISAGLLTMDCAPGDEPRLQIVGWEQRQFVADRSAERMRKLRRKKQAETERDGACDVTCDGKSDDKTLFFSLSSTSLEDREVSIQDRKKTGSGKSDVGTGGAL